jgi:hypothetical protein
MDMQRQIAQALEPAAKDWKHSADVGDLSDAPILLVRSPQKNQTFDMRGDIMFGESPKRKVLCLCGAIADVDSRMASTKKKLGKSVECRSCRNERIAQEMAELRSHFTGEDGENGDQ